MPKTRSALTAADANEAQPPNSPSSALPATMDPLGHVLANVLAADASSPYRLAFDSASIEDIDDLLSLSRSQRYQGYLLD